jgi:hypothetical protein
VEQIPNNGEAKLLRCFRERAQRAEIIPSVAINQVPARAIPDRPDAQSAQRPVILPHVAIVPGRCNLIDARSMPVDRSGTLKAGKKKAGKERGSHAGYGAGPRLGVGHRHFSSTSFQAPGSRPIDRGYRS